MSVLTFNNVNKTVNNFKLNSMTFSMKDQDILGIVGRHGSGKSTIVNLILNFYRPVSGDINVFGFDSTSDSGKIKEITGTIPQNAYFDERKSPMSILKASLKSRNKKSYEELNYLLEYFDLKLKRHIASMSYLDKKKLSIINALSFNPEFIIVDEPNLIPDPETKIKLYNILEEKNREGVAILILTSNLKEAQNICNNIIYINNGKIVEIEDQSQKLSNDKILRYYDKGIDESIFTAIGAKLVRKNSEVVFYYNSNLNLLAQAISNAGLIDYSVEDSTLEDKFSILEKEEAMEEKN